MGQIITMQKRKLVVIAFLFAIICAAAMRSGFAQTPATVVGTVVPDEKAIELRQQTFELVWRTVKEKHFDPTLGGLDWEAVRQRYAPRVAAGSELEFYGLLQQMLGELRQSHFSIVPPVAAISEEGGGGAVTGIIGIDLRVIDGKAVITRVNPESSAARAGLRPGFILQQVDEKSVAQLIATYAGSTERAPIATLRLTRRILAAIDGVAGTEVKLVCLDERNQTQTFNARRERITGEFAPRFGNMPAQPVEFEQRRLSNGSGYIGYIRFNIFMIPMMEKVRAALRDFSDADGLVIDLRGNPGGVGGMASGIAGNLCDKPGSLGTMKLRSGEMRFAIFPQSEVYTGPVAVLIDGLSGSTSEVFSGGIQELGRAVIVGERSVGAALPSLIQKLPTGALFQFAIADFKTPKGVLVEGRGVTPDIEVKWNRASLLAGRDAQLDAALVQLRKAKPKTRTPAKRN